MKQLTYAVVLGAWTITSVAFGGVEYNRKPLPDEENAWTYWESALEHLSGPEGKPLEEAFRSAYDFAEPLPTGKDGRKLKKWLASKQEHLDAISRGIKIGKLQFPKVTHDDFGIRYLTKLKQAARIKIARTRFFMRAGQHNRAGRELLETYRMGQMILQGEGALIHYLVGSSVPLMGLKGMRHLGDTEVAPKDVVADLLSSLSPAGKEDRALAQTYRVEFSCCVIPELKRKIKQVKTSANEFPIPMGDILAQSETKELAKEFFERLIANAFSSWGERDTRIAGDAKAMLKMLEKHADKLQSEITKDTFDSENPESGQKRKKLEQLTKKHPNILGKTFVASMIPSNIEHVLERSVELRTKINLTRTHLSIRLFEKNNGHLPDSLSEVVSAGLLSDTPRDLFSGDTLQYSRQNRKLWSVGPDGEDHAGDEEKDIVVDLPKQEEDSDRK